MTRIMQLAFAIAGFVLVLRYGIVRVPGWGDATSTAPAHWEWHTLPAVTGILCIVIALALIRVRDE